MEGFNQQLPANLAEKPKKMRIMVMLFEEMKKKCSEVKMF